jgi:hypothetical protein
LLFFIAGIIAATADTFTVTTNSDSGVGSLRQAILTNNATPGTNTIAFNISGTTVQTIQPTNPLPTITVPVVIDGYTQTGASANTQTNGSNATLMIEINGSSLGNNANGLYITAGGSTVRGLILDAFSAPGACAIRIETNGENVIEGNSIGLSTLGFFSAPNPNSVGIFIGSGTNLAGGNSPAALNVIANNLIGVWITGAAAFGNAVIGNYIGTDASGNFANLTTLGVGVQIDNASGNAAGFVDPNTGSPLGNLISGNQVGVLITGNGASNNFVLANLIGTDVTDALNVPNDVGIIISNAPANTIGGTDPGDANVIAGNGEVGVSINSGATSNLVQGNFIGTGSLTNNLTLGNGSNGVAIASSSGNLIGGTDAGAGNLIVNNGSDGILIDSVSSSNLIQGNVIEGNGGSGVNVAGAQNTIGGTNSGAGNTIEQNGQSGVVVFGMEDAILGNSIFTNGILGIDLDDDGVTTNQLNNAGTGSTYLQNYPILSNATSCRGLTIIGTLNSTSNTLFHIEFFANTACDPSGYGEGEMFIGWTNLPTDVNGNVSFSVTFTNNVPTGQFITATATDPNGNTSEFSPCLEVDRVRAITVVRPADANCTATVTPAELDSGTTDPCGNPVTLTASPPGPYSLGTNTVTLTAIGNQPYTSAIQKTAIYTNSAQTAIIVVDETPPSIICPADVIRTAGLGETNRVVVFPNPPASDNCGSVTVSCVPPSGSTFPSALNTVTTNPVTSTAIDGSLNSNTCTFAVVILPFGRVTNDLALVNLTVPKTVTLSERNPRQTKTVYVQIQNRAPHNESLTNATVLANMVSLSVQSLGTCPSLTPQLIAPKQFPIVMHSKGKLTVPFSVTFDCAYSQNYRYSATVNHAAIDGQPDGHPDDDMCPRGPLPHGIDNLNPFDPNPDGTIKDYGCGARLPNGQLGGDVLTSVIVK